MDVKNHIFLMYCGYSPDGKEHRKWPTGDIEPVAVYKDSGNSFFQSFLLLGIKSAAGNSLVPGFGTPGNKEDWLSWLDEMFLPEINIEAIARVTEENHLPPADIWISLPYPDPALEDFRLWDRTLRFSRNKDRVLAVRWWVNRCLARWHARIKARGLERFIRLCGFYWPRESMTLKDRLLLPGLISCIQSLGYRTLWIPYFAATPLLGILDPGFDRVIIQPGYLQNPEVGWQRLSEAAKRAGKHGAGLEIELDTAVLYQNSQAYITALDYLNRGLPEYEDYMAGSCLAYYTGYKTMVQLYRNNSPLYTHLYRFVKGTLKKVDYPGIPY